MELELYVFLYCVKTLVPNLLGKLFTVRTDHRNLLHLSNSSAKTSALEGLLSEFQLVIQPIPGYQNVVADRVKNIFNPNSRRGPGRRWIWWIRRLRCIWQYGKSWSVLKIPQLNRWTSGCSAHFEGYVFERLCLGCDAQNCLSMDWRMWNWSEHQVSTLARVWGRSFSSSVSTYAIDIYLWIRWVLWNETKMEILYLILSLLFVSFPSFVDYIRSRTSEHIQSFINSRFCQMINSSRKLLHVKRRARIQRTGISRSDGLDMSLKRTLGRLEQ